MNKAMVKQANEIRGLFGLPPRYTTRHPDVHAIMMPLRLDHDMAPWVKAPLFVSIKKDRCSVLTNTGQFRHLKAALKILIDAGFFKIPKSASRKNLTGKPRSPRAVSAIKKLRSAKIGKANLV